VNARIGVVFRPDFRPDTLRQSALAADHAGVAELWLWEDCFLQGGIAQAAVALASSETLTVGLGVLPAPLRNVVTTAMEIATLEVPRQDTGRNRPWSAGLDATGRRRRCVAIDVDARVRHGPERSAGRAVRHR
jgi:hypothetical protein